MIKLPEINKTYLLDTLQEILSIPSPTGLTERIISFLEGKMAELPVISYQRTAKGALISNWPGESNTSPRGLTAHVDTLGAMVKEIKSNGRLKLSQLGGYAWNTIEGEGCTVFSSAGDAIRGTILLHKASSHVFGKNVGSTERSGDTLEVRLDIPGSSAEEIHQTGIQVGDFVCFDPRIELNKGFIRSRHLDDKASVACLLAAACPGYYIPFQQL
jgi:putative aminopeptidase FrvX